MAVAVGMGLSTYPFDTVDGFWDWVRQCEESEVDSIWQTDTLVSREPMLECMSVMGALAGATRRLKFGMNVASISLRDPLLTAKQCATIDMLSNGRLLPAFGLGSVFSSDWRATGRPTQGRGKRADEALEIMARLWRGEKASYDGEHFPYDNVSISPLPVQQPLPLWVGGSAKGAIRRTARLGTGWQAAFQTPEEAGRIVAEIKQALVEEGRSFDVEHYGTGINYRYGDWEDEAVVSAARRFERVSNGKQARSAFAVGGTAEIVSKIRAFVDNGIIKFVLRPISKGDQDTRAQTQRLIDEVLPEVARLNAERKAAKAASLQPA